MPDRITDAELLARLADCPPVGSRWVHRSGFLAVVTGCAIEEATLFPLVLYRHAGEAAGCPVFARPLASFLDRFTAEPPAKD